MSWSSRFGWPASTGRWSPFGQRSSTSGPSSSSATTGPVLVTDADFSYINPDTDNLDSPTAGEPPSSTSTHQHDRTHPRPSRTADVLHIRYKSARDALHFPPYSISDGALRVGTLREHAAHRLDVADPRRVRMFFKGRNLKNDAARCCDEGLSSDFAAEILCVVGDAAGATSASGGRAGAAQDGDSDGDSDGDGELDGDGDDGPDGDGAGGGATARRKRNRNRRRKNKRGTTTGSTPTTSGTSSPTPLPAPEHFFHHPAPTAPSSSQQPPASSQQQPTTAMGQIAALSAKFHGELVPLCEAFIANPPVEGAKRAFEHKKLSETVLAQVLLKLDAVETGGDDEARRRRKELVKEVQGILTALDRVVGGP